MALDVVTLALAKKYADNVKTFRPFPSGIIEADSLSELRTAVLAFPNTNQGMAYLGEIEGGCTPFNGNGECKVEFMSNGIAVITLYSSNVSPYMWIYNTADSTYTWKSYKLNV